MILTIGTPEPGPLLLTISMYDTYESYSDLRSDTEVLKPRPVIQEKTSATHKNQ